MVFFLQPNRSKIFVRPRVRRVEALPLQLFQGTGGFAKREADIG